MQPIITLTSDWRLRDPYIAIFKGLLQNHLPQANIIDITHHLDFNNLNQTAFLLLQSYPHLPAPAPHWSARVLPYPLQLLRFSFLLTLSCPPYFYCIYDLLPQMVSQFLIVLLIFFYCTIIATKKRCRNICEKYTRNCGIPYIYYDWLTRE